MSFAALFFSLFLFTQLVRVQSAEEDLEVVFLPTEFNSDNATVPLRFSAFGKNVHLLLKKNEQLVAPSFELWKRKRDGLSRIDDYAKYSSCHYLHENSYSSAAVSLCDAGIVQGFVFLENDSLEITPLENEESAMIDNNRLKQVRSRSLGKPHIIKRRRISSFDAAAAASKFDWAHVRMSPRRQESSSYDDGDIKPSAETLTIELGVFLDETAYKMFKAHLSGGGEGEGEGKLLDLLLAYVNNIQALYHHPSLGERIDLALVRLELMQSQPAELAELEGERGEALEAFCKYAESLNPAGDEEPKHWDMGLYVSGLDFYAMENGTRNAATMGLAPVGGVCWDRYACVIAEFGLSNSFGRPFPSAGFTSVYIAAHEMAHNLGMHHDSSNNDCPRDGFIMSPSRGVNGETQWSKCSRELASSLAASKACLLDRPAAIDYQLDHQRRFNQLPGRHWTAKRQCELLLRDRDAFVESPQENCCSSLRCRTPNRIGSFAAGPALDGTRCDEGKQCRAGECLPAIEDDRDAEAALSTSTKASAAGWSSWREGSCESGCIRGSLGFVERRRTCLSPGSRSACPGLDFDVMLCKDTAACEDKSRKRLSAREHAGLRCLEFGDRAGIRAIDPTAGGLQADHEAGRPWVACAVFCKRKDIGSYYAPRAELHDLGVDPYFPDGTWCHRHDGQDYFCRRHHCLPESFRFGKGLPIDAKHEDSGATNAVEPRAIDLNGRPVEGTSREDAWLDFKDYAEMPAARR